MNQSRQDKYGHIMFDLETLDNKNTSSILSIGAVEFNLHTGKIGETLYVRVDLQSCIDEGLTISADTIMWWLRQSDEARARIYGTSGIQLEEALDKVFNFVESCGEDVVVWGNGSTFDISILEYAFYKFYTTLPWKFYNVSDLRTIVNINPKIKKNCPFDGIKHDAIADCKHQIKYLCDTYKTIKVID